MGEVVRASLGAPDFFVTAKEADGNRWQVTVAGFIGEIRVLAHLHIDIVLRPGRRRHPVISEDHHDHSRPNRLVAIAT